MMKLNPAPEIEVTKNNEYVFHDGWNSLINDKIRNIKMDVDAGKSRRSSFRMIFRQDDEFENDFQTLVNKYLKK